MKRVILVTSIIFCSNLIDAQDIQNYNAIVHMIDSMKIEYSVKELINSPMVKRPYQYRKYYEDLTTEYQNKVIDNIRDLYNQTEYLGLYSLASVLLDDYYDYSKEDVRKKIIDVWYDKRCYSSFTITSLGRSPDYSEETKQRLLNILAKKWIQDDIDIWEIRSEQSVRQYYTNDYMKDVEKIMKETNRQSKQIEKMLLDSLVQDAVTRNMEININRPIYENCILMIGSLKDQRFVPGLESMLKEYKDHKDYAKIKEACTYALAKLGVQQYLDSVYAQEFVRYEYLGTKEAFLKELDKRFVWNRGSRMFTNQPLQPSALIILEEAIIYHYLRNVPKEIQIELGNVKFVVPERFADYDPSKDEQNKESIQTLYRIYNWIKDNPDKWELPPAKDSF